MKIFVHAAVVASSCEIHFYQCTAHAQYITFNRFGMFVSRMIIIFHYFCCMSLSMSIGALRYKMFFGRLHLYDWK